MKTKTIKKIALYALSIFAVLVLVLVVHIYIVTRPKAPDEHTLALARIDIKQPITTDDANKITTWLYQQKGIDHVLLNPESNIVVFTFFPIKTTADLVVKNFKGNFSFKADRVIATEDDLKNGCPVAATSVTYKMANFFKHIF